MKVSLSWLKHYIPVEMEADRLAESLTMAGLEVENVYNRYNYLSKVVVGRIIDTVPHPNADRLLLCNVDIDKKVVPVVCGAPNVQKNLLVPVALPGAQLIDGSLVEKGSIRGKLSEGMLCSEAELGLGTDKSGIMILDKKLAIGENLEKALKLSDMVFDIDLTPNRPDCLSIIGIAREISTIQKTSIKYPDFSLSDRCNKISDLTSVTIEAPDLCPRYASRLLFDITVAPSPFWLQDRLMSIGLRPVNNIVDITNFVLMETGQPLHAFDFDCLADSRIVVKVSKEGESFTTLDGCERQLNSDILMICDGEKPVAVAGIMGGVNSEINELTSRIFIESAYFNPVSIRKAAKKLGLNTEASHRFERGVNPDLTVAALNRAAKLMVEIGKGRLVEGVIDKHPKPVKKKRIILSTVETNRLLGTSLDQNKIAELLISIEFNVEINDDDQLIVIPPSFRVDIERTVDLMEEVARLSGYDNIPVTFPMIPAKTRQPAKQIDLKNRIKSLLVGFGFTESINYSFIGSRCCDQLGLSSQDQRRNLVDIINPLTEDQAAMRPSLIPGLLQTTQRNISRQIKNLKLFEIGKIFINKNSDKLPEEIEMLAVLWTGERFSPNWHTKKVDIDFYDIKGIAEGILKGLDINEAEFRSFIPDTQNHIRPGYGADIFVGNQYIGIVGEVHPQSLSSFNINQKAFILEFDLNLLIPLVSTIKHSKPIPKFPAIDRDITIIIDDRIESRKVLESVKNFNNELIENLHLLDVYEGDPIKSGKKSISFRITYRSSLKTLQDNTVTQVHKNITEILLKEFDATLPA